MKILLILVMLTLSGCGAKETLETIRDEPVEPVMVVPREISVSLPDGAVAPVLESDDQQVYFCEDYEIMIETLDSGDLDATMRRICGYGRDQLTVMETQWEDVTRYEFVWAAAGENGDRLGRGVILDDGEYHYCMSVLRDAEKVTQVLWRDVFASFTIL